MPKIILSESYTKRAKRFFRLHRDLLNVYKKKLVLLELNPYHPSLRIHKLRGKHSAKYSILINMKYRVVIDFLIKDDQIILLNIGNHDLMYR